MMKRKLIVLNILTALLFFKAGYCEAGNPLREILYVGTFSERNSQGLYVYEFNRDSLQFTLLQTLPQLKGPSFFTIHPSGEYLYAVCGNAVIEGQPWGSVQALRIDRATGMLTPVNQQSSYGRGPCYISTDPAGKFVFAGNYSDAVVTVYPIHADGSVGDSLQTIRHRGSSINPDRQEAAHVHATLVSADGKFVYVPDLGIDKVMIYRMDAASSRLWPAHIPWAAVKPGSGPRHIAIHPKGNYAYLAEELGNTTAVFERDKVSGGLTEIQRISSLPDDFSGSNTNADIHTDPGGNFLYVSNRGHNSIAIYRIDPVTGKIGPADFEPVRGDHPRNFTIDDTGDLLLVANRSTDNIVVFRRNKKSGKLSFSGREIILPAPVCLKMLILK